MLDQQKYVIVFCNEKVGRSGLKSPSNKNPPVSVKIAVRCGLRVSRAEDGIRDNSASLMIELNFRAGDTEGNFEELRIPGHEDNLTT